MNFIPLAAAQPQGGGIQMIVMLVGLFAIVYFFMIRPQNKKQKEIQKFRNALEVGQDVITIGGIHGTIKRIEDNDIITLSVSTGVEIKFDRSAIMPKQACGVESETGKRTDGRTIEQKAKQVGEEGLFLDLEQAILHLLSIFVHQFCVLGFYKLE